MNIRLTRRQNYITTENAGATGSINTFHFLEAWRKAGRFTRVSFGDRGPGGYWNCISPTEVDEFKAAAVKAGLIACYQWEHNRDAAHEAEAAPGVRETTMTTLTPTLTMQIGRRRYPVATLAEASRMFCAARDKSGVGGSKTPTPILFDANGAQVAYVSYNGRVWAGNPRDWQPGNKPIWEVPGFEAAS